MAHETNIELKSTKCNHNVTRRINLLSQLTRQSSFFHNRRLKTPSNLLGLLRSRSVCCASAPCCRTGARRGFLWLEEWAPCVGLPEGWKRQIVIRCRRPRPATEAIPFDSAEAARSREARVRTAWRAWPRACWTTNPPLPRLGTVWSVGECALGWPPAAPSCSCDRSWPREAPRRGWRLRGRVRASCSGSAWNSWPPHPDERRIRRRTSRPAGVEDCCAWLCRASGRWPAPP